MSTTEDVLNHHLEAFGAQDMDETLSDYADDAVVVTPEETYRGLDEIERLFEGFFAEFTEESTFTLDEQVVEDDYALIVWRADTPENEYEFATDTFVVSDGEIVAQTVTGKITPKM